MITAAQLAANDFPPVCAMSGQIAQLWFKFTFTTVPLWAYAFGLIAVATFGRKATGYLPLTRSSRRTVLLPSWIAAGLVTIGVAMLVLSAGFETAQTHNGVSGTRWLLISGGVLMVLTSLAAFVLIRRYAGPFGRVLKARGSEVELVELMGVHPKFVDAVEEVWRARRALESARPQTSAGDQVEVN